MGTNSHSHKNKFSPYGKIHGDIVFWNHYAPQSKKHILLIMNLTTKFNL